MGITVRSTSTGPNSNGTSTNPSLPAGTTTGDVTYIAAYHAVDGSQYSNSTTTLTAPAGWTTDVSVAGMLVCHRAWQSGDPSSVTITSNTSGWWESLAITFTGADTANPTDAASPCVYNTQSGFATATQRIRAPSVNPVHDNSMLLCVYGTQTSSGHTISPVPTGLTSQASTGNGPGVLLATKTLTNGTPTGNFDSVQSGLASAQGLAGASIVVKASGAAVSTVVAGVPTICGFWNESNNSTPVVLPLERLGVKNNDLILVYTSGAATLTAPTGYTSAISTNNTTLYQHTWLTGDSTAPSFSLAGGAYANFDVFIIRRSDGSGAPGIDTSASATVAGTGVAVSPPSITPAGTNELLFIYYGTHDQSAGTWSAVNDTGLTEEDTNSVGPCSRTAWEEGISSATPSSFTATLSGTRNLSALSVLIGETGTPPVITIRPVLFVIT